jgi:hypothetical protein
MEVPLMSDTLAGQVMAHSFNDEFSKVAAPVPYIPKGKGLKEAWRVLSGGRKREAGELLRKARMRGERAGEPSTHSYKKLLEEEATKTRRARRGVAGAATMVGLTGLGVKGTAERRKALKERAKNDPTYHMTAKEEAAYLKKKGKEKAAASDETRRQMRLRHKLESSKYRQAVGKQRRTLQMRQALERSEKGDVKYEKRGPAGKALQAGALAGIGAGVGRLVGRKGAHGLATEASLRGEKTVDQAFRMIRRGGRIGTAVGAASGLGLMGLGHLAVKSRQKEREKMRQKGQYRPKEKAAASCKGGMVLKRKKAPVAK